MQSKELSSLLQHSSSKASILWHSGFFIVQLSQPYITTGKTIVLTRSTVKNLPAVWETWIRSLGLKDFLREEMATSSSILSWRIPWTEEPDRLQSMGSLRVGHDERLHFHFSLACIGERNGNPLQCSCVENPRDRRAWWAAVYGVAQSRIRLKRLSSSRSLLNISYIFSILVSSLFVCNPSSFFFFFF